MKASNPEGALKKRTFCLFKKRDIFLLYIQENVRNQRVGNFPSA